MFGHFYGFCIGEECIEIYQIADSKLYEDELDQYPTSEAIYEGSFRQLSNDKYELVKDLASQIPPELYLEEDGFIGLPDAADGGGIYVAVRNSLGIRYWLIDQMDNNIPEYLWDFKKDVNESISKINQ